MPAPLTQEQAILNLKEKLGHLYDFSETEYKKSHIPLKVICKQHGEFFATYSNLRAGKTCMKCAKERCSLALRTTLAEFIKKAFEVHGENKYDYSLVDYRKNTIKVKIICRVHGIWEQTPGNHLAGYGCPRCATDAHGLSCRSSAEEYLEGLPKEHLAKYDYSEMGYTRLIDKIKVFCPEHGPFETIAANHRTSGCPSCAVYGFKSTLPASFYVFKSNDITKIGITNRDVNKRLRQVSNSKDDVFFVEAEYKFERGKSALDIETQLLRGLKLQYPQPIEVFDGSTECFYNVDQTKLLNRIEELIAANQEQSP